MNEISIITPVYNEQHNIAPFVSKIKEVMKRINKSYELIFILDPGNDNTENIILEEIQKNSNIKLIINSRRFGQPASMFAGLENSNGKYIVFIDVDLGGFLKLVLSVDLGGDTDLALFGPDPLCIFFFIVFLLFLDLFFE